MQRNLGPNPGVTEGMMRLLSRFRPAVAAAILTLVATGAAAFGATSPTAFTTKGSWTFRSAPHLHPPKLRTDARGVRAPLAAGFFLVANFKTILRPLPFASQASP